MERVSEKDIEWLLQPNQEFDYLSQPSSEEKVKPLSFKRKLIHFGLWLLLVTTLTILPFFLLIRTSVFLNVEQGWNGWLSLAGGIGTTVLLLLAYIIILFRKVQNKKLLMRFSLGGTGALVGGFCLYGLLYLSSVNAKTESVREVYRSLHPILRVAVATTTLAEADLVITDIKRTEQDYAKMGLPLHQSSLHFPQKDGYVHAIDLRTKGHSEFRNIVLNTSIRLMGLHTIRHVGTADHLHISLPVSKN